jgi:hypothetical protein
MSYQEKYLKYKQKYQQLKRQLEGATQMYGGNATATEDYSLTETPTFEHVAQQVAQHVAQRGGSTLAPADFSVSAPLASCAGQANPTPNAMVPGANLSSANVTAAQVAAQAAAPMVDTGIAGSQLPAGLNPQPLNATKSKNFVEPMEETNTTTDLSEIQNTEDIERLFNQFGGKHKKHHKEEEYESESMSSSESGSDSDSDSESGSDSESDSISLSDLDDDM